MHNVRIGMAGAAALACLLAGGSLLRGGHTMPPAPPQSAVGAASVLALSGNIGKICDLRYQDGPDSRPTDRGTLKSVDENWIVLDVLQLKSASDVTDAGGRKYLRAVYSKTPNQLCVSTKLVTAVNFNGDAIIG